MDEPKTPNDNTETAESTATAPTMSDVKAPEPKPVPQVPDAVKETMTTTSESEPHDNTPVMSEPPAETAEEASERTALPVPASPATASTEGVVQKPKNTAMLRIVIAIVLALSLIATAVFIYLGSKDAEKTSSQTEDTKAVQAEPAQPATVSDVDQTVSEVDEALSAADTAQDASSEDLSDAALGL
jgi:uncharacterized protein HemX